MVLQSANLISKNIKDFTSEDTLYIRDMSGRPGFTKLLYLCQFISYNERNKSVTGKILDTPVNKHDNGSSIPVGKELKAGLDNCSLYGKAKEDTQETNHWFNHLGYAMNPLDEYKEAVNDAHVPEHESYGTIRGSRRNGTTTLFGTSVSHNQTIAITISTATHKRDLANDWIHSGKSLIEVELSENQFAQFITSMNQNSGIPCTLRHINGKRLAPTPFISKQELFQEEFEKRMSNLAVDIRKSVETSTEILTKKANITKADREMILKDIQQLVRDVSENIPFVRDQFREQLDDMITEAKVEIEAFAENMIRTKGLEALGASNEEFRNILLANNKKNEE